jgi:hypothetical protein
MRSRRAAPNKAKSVQSVAAMIRTRVPSAVVSVQVSRSSVRTGLFREA